MLDVLHKIQKNKNLIFSNGINADFYSCLTYCLLLITNDGEIKKFTRLNDQKDDYLLEEWFRIEKDLLRERSLWGEYSEKSLNKWKLDFIEGPNR